MENSVKNIIARFLDQTNRGAISEEDFNAAWDNALVAIHALNPKIPADVIKSEGGEALMALCKQVHPTDEKTGKPYIASKFAIVHGVQEAVRAICALVTRAM